MRRSVLVSFSLLSLCLLSYLFNYDWFHLLPDNELLGNILVSIGFTGSNQGILVPLIFLSIHYATTAKECWRVFYCAFPMLTIALLLGLGLQLLTEQPRPHVTKLQALELLPSDYYQQSDQTQQSLMLTALDKDAALPDFVKSDWLAATSYAMPSAHAIGSMMLAMYFASLFFANQRNSTAYIIIGWAVVVMFSQLLIGLVRHQDILVGALIGTAAAWLALWNRRRKANQDIAIAALRAKKLAEQEQLSIEKERSANH